MKKRIVQWFLLLMMILTYFPVQAEEKLPGSGEIYDSALEHFHRGRYGEAIDGFNRVIRSFPTSKLVPYAQFMMGQALLKMKRYEEAIEQFEFYLRTYPEGDRARESEQGLKEAREKIQRRREGSETIAGGKLHDQEPKKSEALKASEHSTQKGLIKGSEGAMKTTVMEAIDSRETLTILSKEETPSLRVLKEPTERPIEEIAPKTQKVRRRICAQITYLDGRNWNDVEKRIKELKEAGVDTIIFRVFQNKGDRIYKFVKTSQEEGVYFKTQHALVLEDILEKVAEIVHRNELELFAWMTTRYATYGTEKKPEYWSKHYNFETKKMEIGRGLNLYHPDVLKRLEGIFRDLGRYPIDGILFQDDLVLRHNEDFSLEANRAFLKEFGYSPHPDIFYVEPYLADSGKYHVKGYTDQFWTWAKWKNRYLMEVAERLMMAARESNPKLQFMINLYFEAVLNDSNGVAWFSQTLPEALRKGFDYYAIMAYHRQAMKGRKIELQEAVRLMAEATQKAVHSIGDPSQVVMKIWILDWKTNEAVGLDLAPRKEIEEVLESVLNQGDVSLAFVPYTHLFPLHPLKERWIGSKK